MPVARHPAGQRAAAADPIRRGVPCKILLRHVDRVTRVTDMPTISHFISLIAAAVLAFHSMTASAERIHFDSAARDSDFARIFQAKTQYADHIHGDLQLPVRGTGPFPAMVIMHSSRGIDNSIGNWAKTFNEIGVATFVVDSFTPRGLSELSADRLTFSAGVVDSLRAFNILQRDARVDSRRIGVIGFSRGAIAAMDSGFNRYRAAVLGQDAGKFALHIVFHGGCAQYAKTTDSPILIFLGTNDDFNNLGVKFFLLRNQNSFCPAWLRCNFLITQ